MAGPFEGPFSPVVQSAVNFALQFFDIDDATASGNTGLLDGSVTQVGDTVSIPIGAGAVSTLPGDGYWLEFPLNGPDGASITHYNEFLTHVWNYAIDIPTGLWIGLAMTSDGMGGSGGGCAWGLNAGVTGWHSTRVAGIWNARTPAGAADTLSPVQWGIGVQGNSTNQQRVTSGLSKVDGVTPSAVSATATALSSSNAGKPYSWIALLCGRTGTTVETLVGQFRSTYLTSGLSQIPGAARFLA